MQQRQTVGVLRLIHARRRANTGISGKKKGPEINPDPDDWWRRGESNPRPQILCLRPYMLSLVFALTFRCPTGRATNGGSGEF